MKFNIKIRKIFAELFGLFGARPNLFFSKNFEINVLNYHFFSKDNDGSVELEDLEINISVLEKQLLFFSKECEIINVKNQDIKSIRSSLKPQLLLTIDDGDLSTLEALKILSKYEIPAILFIPFGLCLPDDHPDGIKSRLFNIYSSQEFSIEEKRQFFRVVSKNNNEINKNLLEQYLEMYPANLNLKRKKISMKKLNQLAHSDLFTISSHSMSHPIMSALPKEWQQWEIETAKKYVKDIGGNVDFFAYPFGFAKSFNTITKDILKMKDISYAFTTRSRLKYNNNALLEIGRTGVHNISSKYYLRGLANGVFELFDRILSR